MKYRTIIEVICEASNREEAANIAGEYLKGDLDFGVSMKCKSEALSAHKALKYSAVCMTTVLLLSTLMVKVTPFGGNEKVASSFRKGVYNTYTVMPALKTKHKADFKKEWEAKKDQAILDYLKK
ncbi:MAG: hypothetical protein GF408_02505 [Candidatus Omnitrophica bacterium]|nr:hypothetical protein [Candidatus Omnitrophota bacterium]